MIMIIYDYDYLWSLFMVMIIYNWYQIHLDALNATGELLIIGMHAMSLTK